MRHFQRYHNFILYFVFFWFILGAVRLNISLSRAMVLTLSVPNFRRHLSSTFLF